MAEAAAELTTQATAGVTNTGGGAGGATSSGDTGGGGKNGGPGIVLIRYQ